MVGEDYQGVNDESLFRGVGLFFGLKQNLDSYSSNTGILFVPHIPYTIRVAYCELPGEQKICS